MYKFIVEWHWTPNFACARRNNVGLLNKQQVKLPAYSLLKISGLFYVQKLFVFAGVVSQCFFRIIMEYNLNIIWVTPAGVSDKPKSDL